MDGIIAWVAAEGRLPKGRSGDRSERSMARAVRRPREAAEGSLDPAYSAALSQVPGWLDNRREAEDEARRQHRPGQLVDFREEGNDWPRHHHYASARGHAFGVWIHTQRHNAAAADSIP